MGYLISETTREEREQIVKDSLGNIDASCDGCMRDINMGFRTGYIKEDETPMRSGCSYM